MNMKLSYRDKVILIIVIVLVVLGAGIFCFIKPKYEALQVSKDRLAAKEAEKAEVEAKMGTLEDLKKKLEDDIKAVEEDQKQFLSEKDYGETYLISQYLMQKLEPTGITITGVDVPQLEALDIEAYEYNKLAVAYPMKINSDISNELPEEVIQAYNNSYPDKASTVELASSIVTVNYTADSDEDIFKAVDTIFENEENLHLLTVSAEYSEEASLEAGEPTFEGALTIQVFEIYPMDPEALED